MNHTPSVPGPVRVTVPKAPGYTWFLGIFGTLAINVFAVWAFVRGGVTGGLIAAAIVSYFVRIFAITAVYHRYFSHRAYRTSRIFQLFLAFLGTTATQKGPLWWAGSHRHHHRYSDQPEDLHSPERRGFWHSHMGWWLGREYENFDEKNIQDFYAFPELRWLDRHHYIGPFALMGLCYAVAGLDGMLWGFVVPTAAVHHCTFFINSLAHVWGSRRFATTDTSRNNFLLALVTMGEGWHNNHHHYQSSARQGFYWWEVDFSFYVLKGLEKLGLVWDLREVPEHALKRNLISEVGERSPLLLAKRGLAPVDAPTEAPAEPALMDAE